jgi:hypothetical protein
LSSVQNDRIVPAEKEVEETGTEIEAVVSKEMVVLLRMGITPPTIDWN